MLSLKSRVKLLDNSGSTSKKSQNCSSPLGGSKETSSQQQLYTTNNSSNSTATTPRSQQSSPTPAATLAEQHSSTSSRSYLVISVIEARNLVAKDHDTHSSDPFVRITLASVSKKTRAINRNCHPLWEQQLVLPVEGLSEAEPLLVEVFDKNYNGKVFLGQVMMTLGKALEIEADEAQRSCYWLVLGKRSSRDVVAGELCLGFEVLALEPQQHMQLSSDLEASLSSEQLAASLSAKALKIQIQGINGLAGSGLFQQQQQQQHSQQPSSQPRPSSPPQQQQQLSLFIKYGRMLLEKPLLLPNNNPAVTSEDDPDSASGCPDSHELSVNEEVTVPLSAAVRAAALVARKKDELLDVKFYLKSHDTLIAKTQVPITSVIGRGSSSPRATAAQQQHTVLTPPLTARSTQVEEEGHSMPTTPRGTVSDYVAAAASGSPASSSSPVCSQLASSPQTATRNNKSDAFGITATVLNKRLGALGHGPGSSNLSTLSIASSTTTTSSLASTLATTTGLMEQGNGRGWVEGSLDSVTACSRGQHGMMGGLQGRRVQGLAELTVRKPIWGGTKIREVNRTAIWVPSSLKAADCSETEEPNTSDCNHQQQSHQYTRLFTRVMESKVPMFCNIQLSVGLAVVAQQQKTAVPDSSAASMSEGAPSPDELSEDSLTSEDDDHNSSPVTPLQPGPALETLLQDVTLPGISTNRLYALLISADSQLMKDHHAAHDVTEMVVGPWRAGGDGCLRVRDVSYVKKLNIPLPLAPEKCNVWETHRLITKRPGGWIVQLTCTNNAPKGECFVVQVELVAVYVSSSCSRLRISMQLNWTKNTWGKGMVEGGARKDAMSSWHDVVLALKLQAGTTVSGKASSGSGEAVVVAEAAGGAVVGGQPLGVKGGSSLVSSINVGVMLQVALVLALLVLAWAIFTVSFELRSLRHSSTGFM